MPVESIVTWEHSPFTPQLSATEIHLWSARVSQCLPLLNILQSTLAGDEFLRANQFRFAHDREAFVVARGMLRFVLGSYLEIAPPDLRFGYGAQGKPFVPEFPHCQFNLSHSADLIVCAVAQNHALGIDVEKIRPEFVSEEIAENYFAASEIKQLRSLPASAQTAAFFRCWTRKEAYIKARAEGLSIPLDTFCVSLLPDARPALLHVENQPAEITRWSMLHFVPAPEFIGALVTENKSPTYKYFQFAN